MASAAAATGLLALLVAGRVTVAAAYRKGPEAVLLDSETLPPCKSVAPDTYPGFCSVATSAVACYSTQKTYTPPGFVGLPGIDVHWACQDDGELTDESCRGRPWKFSGTVHGKHMEFLAPAGIYAGACDLKPLAEEEAASDGSNTPTGNIASHGSQGSTKPEDGTAATKPEDGTAAAKPEDGTAAAKPEDGTAAAKPEDGAAAKPEGGTAPDGSAKPSGGSAKPNEGTASHGSTKPSEDSTEPNDGVASHGSNKPADDSASRSHGKPADGAHGAAGRNGVWAAYATVALVLAASVGHQRV